MDLEKIYLTRYLHCPNCNNMYIIMDREIIACPRCNLLRIKKFNEFKTKMSTFIQKKGQDVHYYYDIARSRILREKQ
ncbi:MAG: hypothetical protein ACFFHD_07060 [Promethearchaeota archaeon]